MSTWTKEQRAIAAAHLCDLAARALRAGDNYNATPMISRIIKNDEPERNYRFALGCYGTADIDAAVVAISRGEHPPDSLPARLAEVVDLALREGGVDDPDAPIGASRAKIRGHGACASNVLTWIGCEVPK